MSFSSYASTTNQKTDASTWTDLGGLSLTLPRGGHTDVSRNTALVILNVPNPYATGNSNPGAAFGITANGVPAEPFACFSYAEKGTGVLCPRPGHAGGAGRSVDRAQDGGGAGRSVDRAQDGGEGPVAGDTPRPQSSWAPRRPMGRSRWI
jgi:hypothetical protein